MTGPLRPVILACLVTLGLGAQEPVPAGCLPRGTAEEVAVVREIAKIRRYPKEYAKYLRFLGTRFQGTLWRLRDHVPLRTEEGREAVEEAAAFLENVEPIKEPLAFSQGLHWAARAHVLDQGPSGHTSHVGEDKSTPGQRMKRFGTPGTLMGEVINYGAETPRMTVIQLVIDDGVPDRGHRRNLFDPKFRLAGAAIGFHKAYGSMTVVDLADGFTEKEPEKGPAALALP